MSGGQVEGTMRPMQRRDGVGVTVGAMQRQRHMRRRQGHARRRGQAGFSLIELLIVVVVIGILAMIAIPLYLQQRDKARDAAVEEGVWSIQIAVVSYACEHDGVFPDPSEVAHDGAVGDSLDQWPENPWTGAPMVNVEEYSKGDFCYEAWSGDVADALAAALPDYDEYGLLGWTSTEDDPYVARPLSGSPPLTSLGSTFTDISGGMISLIQDFYDENGRYPRSWGDYRFTDIGLDPEEWGEAVDHLFYGPGGTRVSVKPEDGWAMEVQGLDGETRVLTEDLHWNIWYDMATQAWYYHDIEPGNEVDIETLVVRPE